MCWLTAVSFEWDRIIALVVLNDIESGMVWRFEASKKCHTMFKHDGLNAINKLVPFITGNKKGLFAANDICCFPIFILQCGFFHFLLLPFSPLFQTLPSSSLLPVSLFFCPLSFHLYHSWIGLILPAIPWQVVSNFFHFPFSIDKVSWHVSYFHILHLLVSIIIWSETETWGLLYHSALSIPFAP